MADDIKNPETDNGRKRISLSDLSPADRETLLNELAQKLIFEAIKDFGHDVHDLNAHIRGLAKELEKQRKEKPGNASADSSGGNGGRGGSGTGTSGAASDDNNNNNNNNGQSSSSSSASSSAEPDQDDESETEAQLKDRKKFESVHAKVLKAQREKEYKEHVKKQEGNIATPAGQKIVRGIDDLLRSMKTATHAELQTMGAKLDAYRKEINTNIKAHGKEREILEAHVGVGENHLAQEQAERGGVLKRGFKSFAEAHNFNVPSVVGAVTGGAPFWVNNARWAMGLGKDKKALAEKERLQKSLGSERHAKLRPTEFTPDESGMWKDHDVAHRVLSDTPGTNSDRRQVVRDAVKSGKLGAEEGARLIKRFTPNDFDKNTRDEDRTRPRPPKEEAPKKKKAATAPEKEKPAETATPEKLTANQHTARMNGALDRWKNSPDEPTEQELHHVREAIAHSQAGGSYGELGSTDKKTVDNVLQSLLSSHGKKGPSSSPKAEQKKGTPPPPPSGKTPPSAESKRAEVGPGDYVQWASQGVDQFAQPRKVTSVSDDGMWAFVEGSGTGIPVHQLKKAQPQPASPTPVETKSNTAPPPAPVKESTKPEAPKPATPKSEAPKPATPKSEAPKPATPPPPPVEAAPTPTHSNEGVDPYILENKEKWKKMVERKITVGHKMLFPFRGEAWADEALKSSVAQDTAKGKSVPEEVQQYLASLKKKASNTPVIDPLARRVVQPKAQKPVAKTPVKPPVKASTQAPPTPPPAPATPEPVPATTEGAEQLGLFGDSKIIKPKRRVLARNNRVNEARKAEIAAEQAQLQHSFDFDATPEEKTPERISAADLSPAVESVTPIHRVAEHLVHRSVEPHVEPESKVGGFVAKPVETVAAAHHDSSPEAVHKSSVLGHEPADTHNKPEPVQPNTHVASPEPVSQPVGVSTAPTRVGADATTETSSVSSLDDKPLATLHQDNLRIEKLLASQVDELKQLNKQMEREDEEGRLDSDAARRHMHGNSGFTDRKGDPKAEHGAQGGGFLSGLLEDMLGQWLFGKLGKVGGWLKGKFAKGGPMRNLFSKEGGPFGSRLKNLFGKKAPKLPHQLNLFEPEELAAKGGRFGKFGSKVGSMLVKNSERFGSLGKIGGKVGRILTGGAEAAKGAEGVVAVTKATGMLGGLGKVFGKVGGIARLARLGEAIPGVGEVIGAVMTLFDFLVGFFNPSSVLGKSVGKIDMITRVAGGIGGIAKGLGGIVDLILGLFGIKSNLGGVLGKFVGKFVQTALRLAKTAFAPLIIGFKLIQKAFNAIPWEKLSDIVDSIFEPLETFLDDFDTGVQGLVDGIGWVMKAATSPFELAKKAIDGIKWLLDKLAMLNPFNWGKKAVSAAGSGVKKVANAVLHPIDTIGSAVKGAAGAVGSAASGAAHAVLHPIDTIGSAVKGAANWVGGGDKKETPIEEADRRDAASDAADQRTRQLRKDNPDKANDLSRQMGNSPSQVPNQQQGNAPNQQGNAPTQEHTHGLWDIAKSLFGIAPEKRTPVSQIPSDGGSNTRSTSPYSVTKEGGQDYARLGQLSAVMESRGDAGAVNVANAAKDSGGFSYGMYQMNTRNNWQATGGTMKGFLQYLAKTNPDIAAKLEQAGGLNGAISGDKKFIDTFKGLGSNEDFKQAQHSFIGATHYQPVANLANKMGLNLDGRGDGVKQMMFSAGVQGPGMAQRVLKQALSGVSPEQASKMSDEEVMKRFQQAKYKSTLTWKNTAANPDLLARVGRENQYLMGGKGGQMVAGLRNSPQAVTSESHEQYTRHGSERRVDPSGWSKEDLDSMGYDKDGYLKGTGPSSRRGGGSDSSPQLAGGSVGIIPVLPRVSRSASDSAQPGGTINAESVVALHQGDYRRSQGMTSVLQGSVDTSAYHGRHSAYRAEDVSTARTAVPEPKTVDSLPVSGKRLQQASGDNSDLKVAAAKPESPNMNIHAPKSNVTNNSTTVGFDTKAYNSEDTYQRLMDRQYVQT